MVLEHELDRLEEVQLQLSESDTYNDRELMKQLHTSQNDLQAAIQAAEEDVDTMEHEYLELLCEEE